MIQSLGASDEQFLRTLTDLTHRINTAMTQVTSGRQINVASDQPDEVSAVLSARAQIEQTSQIATNLARSKNEAASAEQAVSTVVSVLDQLNKIGAQGGTDTLPADQRKALSGQVQALLVQLV